MKDLIKSIFVGLLTILALVSTPMAVAFDKGALNTVASVPITTMVTKLPTWVPVANTSYLTKLPTLKENIEISVFDTFDPDFELLAADSMNTEPPMIKGASIQPLRSCSHRCFSGIAINKTGPPTGIPILFKS